MMLALVAAVAPLPANQIAPPLDVPIQQVQAQVRDDGRSRRTFRLTRTLKFSAEPEGFRVLVTALSADAEADPAERERYRTAQRGFLKQAITVHIDSTGKLRSVDDLDAIWSAWTDGLVAAQGDANSPAASTAVERLGATTLQQRTALMGAIVTSIIASPQERQLVPERPVTFTSPPPFGQVILKGTTAVTEAGGQITTRTTAAGTAATGGTRVSMANTQTIDASSGLLVRKTERTATSLPGGNLTVEKTETLTW